MFNLDDITTKIDNADWPYRKLIIGPSGSGKTNYLLNSIQKDNNIIDKIYIYAKDLEEPKYQLSIKKENKQVLKIYKITMLLLNILTVWIIFMMALMIIIKKGKEKYRLCLLV